MEITTQRRADLVSDAWLKGCDGVWGSLGALGTPEEVRRSRSPPGKMAQHSWASAPRRPGFPWCGWAACHTEQRGWDAAPGMRGAGDSLHLGDQGDAAPEAGRVAGGQYAAPGMRSAWRRAGAAEPEKHGTRAVTTPALRHGAYFYFLVLSCVFRIRHAFLLYSGGENLIDVTKGTQSETLILSDTPQFLSGAPPV